MIPPAQVALPITLTTPVITAIVIEARTKVMDVTDMIVTGMRILIVAIVLETMDVVMEMSTETMTMVVNMDEVVLVMGIDTMQRLIS